MAADRGPAALARHPARLGYRRSRPYDLLPAQPGPDARRVAGAGPEDRTCSRRDRFNWPEGTLGTYMRRQSIPSNDVAQAPAAELAALYHERWEIESALAELKTQLRGAQVVLRRKTPELVRQEFWGLLLAHFAVRGLMHEAALKADEDPDRLSFSHAVRVVRRKLPLFAALSPSGQRRPAPGGAGRDPGGACG